jgi:malonyl CoA-acyl carrier protein transacylase
VDIIGVFSGTARELAMAKGQLRSTKEKKKPKAEWNKKKKGGPPPSPTVSQIQSALGHSPFAKKT